jgi:hypothetical protein
VRARRARAHAAHNVQRAPGMEFKCGERVLCKPHGEDRWREGVIVLCHRATDTFQVRVECPETGVAVHEFRAAEMSVRVKKMFGKGELDEDVDPSNILAQGTKRARRRTQRDTCSPRQVEAKCGERIVYFTGKQSRRGGVMELGTVTRVTDGGERIWYGDGDDDYVLRANAKRVRSTREEIDMEQIRATYGGVLHFKDIPSKAGWYGGLPGGDYAQRDTEQGDGDEWTYDKARAKRVREDTMSGAGVKRARGAAVRPAASVGDEPDNDDEPDSDDEPLSMEFRGKGPATKAASKTTAPPPRQSRVLQDTQDIECIPVDEVQEEVKKNIEEFYNRVYLPAGEAPFGWDQDIKDNDGIKGVVIVKHSDQIIQAATIGIYAQRIVTEDGRACKVAELGDLLCTRSRESSRKIIKATAFFAMDVFGAEALFALIGASTEAEFPYTRNDFTIIKTLAGFNRKREDPSAPPIVRRRHGGQERHVALKFLTRGTATAPGRTIDGRRPRGGTVPDECHLAGLAEAQGRAAREEARLADATERAEREEARAEREEARAEREEARAARLAVKADSKRDEILRASGTLSGLRAEVTALTAKLADLEARAAAEEERAEKARRQTIATKEDAARARAERTLLEAGVDTGGADGRVTVTRHRVESDETAKVFTTHCDPLTPPDAPGRCRNSFSHTRGQWYWYNGKKSDFMYPVTVSQYRAPEPKTTAPVPRRRVTWSITGTIAT